MAIDPILRDELTEIIVEELAADKADRALRGIMQGPSLVLSEDDVDDLNKALSLACVGAGAEGSGDGASGIHLASLCDSIAEHLCNIRRRHTPEGRYSAKFQVVGAR